ncbi:MAG: YceI family protein [Thermoanaerobaculia bacterium]|nr:YceI family protein [Thermoanaerobaculia bacterium]
MQPRHLLAPLLLTAALLPPVAAAAAEQQFRVDAAQSRIAFQVDARLHLVRGTLPVASGELRIDPGTGTASGEVVADARRAATGNGMRDRKMHDDVLLSAAFPAIVFTAEGFEGAAIEEGRSTARLRGRFSMAGREHAVTLDATLERQGDELVVTSEFGVPFRKWGLKDPSLPLLRLADEVQVTVRLQGKLTP